MQSSPPINHFEYAIQQIVLPELHKIMDSSTLTTQIQEKLHPMVTDFQVVHLWGIAFNHVAIQYGWYALLYLAYLVAATIDMQFWSCVLFPILVVSLPWISLLFAIDSEVQAAASTEALFRVLKRWADAATWPYWVALDQIGVSLWDDKHLPFFILMQWFMLPYNAFIGFFILIMFPLQVCSMIYMVWFDENFLGYNL